MQRVLTADAARKKWEAEHPEEAAAERARRQAEYEAEQKREIERARQRTEESLPEKLRRLDVPALAIQALAKPEDTPALRVAKQWSGQSDFPCLLLVGSPGTGKTVAAAWAMSRHVATKGESLPSGGGRATPRAMFVRASTFARMSAYDAKDREWFEDCCRTSFLVLDDLGAEFLGEVAKALLDELIDARTGSLRRTVITSNLGMQQFEDRYEGRIWDRLRPSSTVFGTGKQSMRRRPAKKPEVRQ